MTATVDVFLEPKKERIRVVFLTDSAEHGDKAQIRLFGPDGKQIIRETLPVSRAGMDYRAEIFAGFGEIRKGPVSGTYEAVVMYHGRSFRGSAVFDFVGPKVQQEPISA